MTEPVAGGDTNQTSELAPQVDPINPGETAEGAGGAQRKRRRGSRGGRGRSRAPGLPGDDGDLNGDDTADDSSRPELPDPPGEGEVRAARLAPAARRPQIGDSRPAPASVTGVNSDAGAVADKPASAASKRRRGAKPKVDGAVEAVVGADEQTLPKPKAPRQPREPKAASEGSKSAQGGGRQQSSRKRTPAVPVQATMSASGVELDEKTMARRRGKERNGKPVGRYLMAVHVTDGLKQIAVLEGRSLIEHYVSRPADDVSEIHGNIYLGKVQNVLPGMEAAFVDISTPKNAVLYAGDVSADHDDLDAPKLARGAKPRIENMLKAKQMIVCQVTKNPIGAKGARLTQEVSLPGRFVVLIPNSKTYGISKRLPDDERKRLRAILDKVKPAHHGVIVRTAAEGVVEEELRTDVLRLLHQWDQIDALAKQSKMPALLYREPDMAVRVIREEFNANYRQIVIDDRALFEDVRDYVGAISPALVERVEYYDPKAEGLPLFERQHIHEQVHKALDRKVWLPSGGSLIIEHTEALTVIDVNTGKNVGSTSLEDTVLANNLEAAAEIAHQLRLRDVGGIIVIDFIDMEIRENRTKVVSSFKQALARDKTRTQVFDISELGLVEMTRKRIGEGLLTAYADKCAVCSGRGLVVDAELLS
jgi:ribonuclease E